MILFVCETQAQVINAINIRYNEYPNKNVDLCICNNTEKTQKLYESIIDKGVFTHTYAYKTILNTDQSVKSKIYKAINNIFLLNRMNKILPNCDCVYERIYIAGPSLSCIGVYYYFYKKNNNTRLSLYEEGLYEYYMFTCNNRLKKIYSKIMYGTYYIEKADNLFVYNPDCVLNKPSSFMVKKINILLYIYDVIWYKSYIIFYYDILMMNLGKNVILFLITIVTLDRYSKQNIFFWNKHLQNKKKMIFNVK